MKKFSKRQIAGLLACVLFIGNKTSAMNQSEVKSLGTIGKAGEVTPDDKNLKNKIPAPPEDLPKNFYPLWIALSLLGFSAAVILGVLGIKKLCNKDSGGQEKTPSGTFYQGLGKSKNIEELKNAWESENVFCEGTVGKESRIGKKLLKLISDNKEFGQFLFQGQFSVQGHKQESELAKLKVEYLNDKDRYTFGAMAEIRFDDKGNFECYYKGKKLNLLKYERFFIDYIAKYTKEKLGILPCMVHYDGEHRFYFGFSFDASNKEFREDVKINYEKNTLLKQIFRSRIVLSNIECELDMWGKQTK